MHREPTSSRVKAATAAITLEVLRLLVGDENLEVVKVALAVEAPRTVDLLLKRRVSLSFLSHIGNCRVLQATEY